jgi:hypothetical protein
MPKPGKRAKREELPETLKGWEAIGAYLGIGAATAQRWAESGMPVKREERSTVADDESIDCMAMSSPFAFSLKPNWRMAKDRPRCETGHANRTLVQSEISCHPS